MESINNSSANGRRLNWQQACAYLGCSKSHFYRLVNSGKLRAIRLGESRRNLKVYEEDCRELLNKSASQ